MRLPRVIPPAWRQLASGGADAWQLVGVAAAVAGAAWLLSPYSTLQKVAEKRGELTGRQPNPTGRALGLTAGQLTNAYQDPIEVLAMRAAVARAGSPAPEYRGSRSELFRPYHHGPRFPTAPMQSQRLNLIGAQRPFRGEPIQPTPGVAITAADVLKLQATRPPDG